MGRVAVTLPGGIGVDGQWYRDAWLKPLTGVEEEFLLDQGRFLSPAAKVTELLSRCLSRLGPIEPVDAGTVRRLSVGDRESLLLHLRRLTLGDRVACILHCPACAKKMDLDLRVGELLLPPYRHETSIHEACVEEGEASFRVVFRPPNGEDQEEVATLAANSLASAQHLVLRRCILRVIANGKEVAEFPEAVLSQLPAKMAEVDPQAEVLLDLSCPECEAKFIVPFDITDYFLKELGNQERDFYRGIHLLSYHYHWDEESILNLDRRKRHVYIELLADQVAGGGHR